MGGLLNALNASKLGMFSSQGGLQATSHNIANVNTEGYSKQTPVFSPISGGFGLRGAGIGVRLDFVKRQIDPLLEQRILVGEGELGRMSARERVLPLIEDVLNEMDGDGLSKKLDAFFSAADTLASIPSNPVSRTQLLLEGDALAKQFQSMRSALTEAALPVDQEITYMVEDITIRLANIQSVNKEIVHREASPQQALDLKDQRAEMLRDLGQLMDIKVFENPDGGVSVISGGGKLLMDENYVATLSRGAGLTSNNFVGVKLDDRDFQDLTGVIQSGGLKGLIEVRDELIYGASGFLTKLEKVADELRFITNKEHSQSIGNALHTSQTGVFYLDAGERAKAINTLVTDPEAAGYAGAPPDMLKVQAGTVTIAVGNDVDNLALRTFTVDPATDTIDGIIAKINALAGLDASVDANGKARIAASNAGEGYGIVADPTGIIAALGVGAFFQGIGMSDMEVNPAVFNSSDLVGAARVIGVDDNSDGTWDRAVYDDANSDGAMALSNLRFERVSLFGFSATITSHYAGVVGEIGSVHKLNMDAMQTAESARDFLIDQREGVSGISLEEEMTNLIRFQRSFQASSKAISVADELFESMLAII